jgi:ribosome-binding factor A
MKDFKRSQRLGDQIKRDVAILVLNLFQDKGANIPTVTAVEVTDDLRYAKVFYTVPGDDERRAQAKESLARLTGRIQSELAHSLRVRRMPEISFHFDTSLEQGMRILTLLDELKSKDNDPKN